MGKKPSHAAVLLSLQYDVQWKIGKTTSNGFWIWSAENKIIYYAMQLYADRYLIRCVKEYKVLYTNQPAELFLNWQSHEMVIFFKDLIFTVCDVLTGFYI
jgi:hypothetical protein